MTSRGTRSHAESREGKGEAEAVERQLRRAFTPEVIDQLRAETGYNPRQRVGTAFRLMLTVVEAFLVGTIGFDRIHTVNARTLEGIVPEAGECAGVDGLLQLDARAREHAARQVQRLAR